MKINPCNGCYQWSIKFKPNFELCEERGDQIGESFADPTRESLSLFSSLRNDLTSLNELISQKRRAVEIIKENRKRAVTYWTAQQLMLHNKCKERGAVEDTLISPETSFVMPLHLLKKPENGNLEEALREHEVSH